MKYIQPIIIAVLILSLLLVKQCEVPKIEYMKEVYTDTIIKTTIDTQYFEKTINRTVTKLDTVNRYIYPDSSQVYRFKTSFEDSLLKGSIVSGIKMKDDSLYVLAQYLDYQPKFPKYIYRTDSIWIKDSVVITKVNDKVNFLVGSSIGYNMNGSNVDFYPSAGIQLKNQSIFEVSFSPFSKTVLFGAKFRLKF